MSQLATLEPIVQMTNLKDRVPASEVWRCQNSLCAAAVWTVERLSADHSLWRVSNETSDGSWVVAGVTPACPLCGTGLPIPPTN
jgi:hypothetical protein